MTHFRHGARAPIRVDQNNYDKVNEKWTNPGELTAVGMRMHYLLGLRNRQRYIEEYKLLSPTFDPHEILVYSTNVNRTIISAYSQLQGLYPSDSSIGFGLTEEQEKFAVPQVNCNSSYIQEKVKNMNYSALPNFMTLIPVHIINENDKKPQNPNNNNPPPKNDKSLNELHESIKVITEFFNANYTKYLKELYGENSVYDFTFISDFCDGFVASYTDRRKLTNLKNTGIDFEELISTCYDVQKIKFRDSMLNGGKSNTDKVQSKNLLLEMLELLKKRVEDDINKKEIKYGDFSRPKMMMISAHDTTVSCNEMTFINSFNLDVGYYKLPKFASQIAFEVTRKDDNEINDLKLSYDDYTVNYYFNDEKVYSTSLNNFIKKLESYLLTGEEKNNNNNDKHKEILIYRIVVLSLAGLVVVLLIIVIILSVLYCKEKKGKKNSGSDMARISLIGVDDDREDTVNTLL